MSDGFEAASVALPAALRGPRVVHDLPPTRWPRLVELDMRRMDQESNGVGVATSAARHPMRFVFSREKMTATARAAHGRSAHAPVVSLASACDSHLHIDGRAFMACAGG